MKCIKHADGTISRIPNQDAAKVVKEGQATYVPKREWKEQRRAGSAKKP